MAAVLVFLGARGTIQHLPQKLCDLHPTIDQSISFTEAVELCPVEMHLSLLSTLETGRS